MELTLIALGWASEARSSIALAARLGILAACHRGELESRYAERVRALEGLIRSLESRA